MGQRGFSLIEAIAATALTLAITAVAFALIDPVQTGFAAQPEAADMQQRLRVAAGTLHKDLAMAGAGPSRGANTGSLGYYFAPVLPYRLGTNHDDPPGSFRTDTITLMFVPPTFAQTTLAAEGPGAVPADIGVNIGAGCPSGDALCGFQDGMSILIFDAAGVYDTFSITEVQDNLLHVERTGGSLTQTNYQPHTSTVVQARSIVYSLKIDAAGTYQLVSSDGGGADVPVVDHLVALAFEYYGDSQPPALSDSGDSGPGAARTTYGPAPPALGEQISTGDYPAGENCTFAIDPGSGLQVPRLEVLGSSPGTSAIVPLASTQLTDGPWCPDATNVNRWDADLLRIRKIRVTLRVQAANAALRGPASVLFAHGGSSKNAYRWLPDLQVKFDVAPRNLAFGR
jgi:hypothetical protein